MFRTVKRRRPFSQPESFAISESFAVVEEEGEEATWAESFFVDVAVGSEVDDE